MQRLGNTLHDVLDQYTKESVSYDKTTLYHDGSTMNDSKVDGIIYKKYQGEYFKRNIDNYINIKWFGVKGDGITNDAPLINSTIQYLKGIREGIIGKRGSNLSLFFPAGKYRIDSPIFTALSIDLIGAGKHDSVIIANNTQIGGIIMNEAGQETDILLLHMYTTIKGLGIMGGDYLINPFADKTDALDHSAAIGIDIHNHRVRIIECAVEGWSNIGINASGVYYIYIDKNYVSNNKIGYQITNVSTSNYLSLNEFRYNSIALAINGNSFANFITNNMFESNFAAFMPYEILNSGIIASTGKAILIDGAANNFIGYNYFENHCVSLVLNNATRNNICNNYFVPADSNPGHADNIADFICFYGAATNNRFLDNTMEFSDPVNHKANIRVLNPGLNYSSNYITFAETNFNKVVIDNLSKWQTQFSGIESNAPVIADQASGIVYRKLVIDNPGKWTDITGGIEYPLTARIHGSLGVGTTAAPITRFEVKADTNVHLGMRIGEANPAAIQLNAFNDGGAANIPMEFKATAFNFTNSPISILDGTASNHAVSKAQLDGAVKWSSALSGAAIRANSLVGINTDPTIQFDVRVGANTHMGFFHDGTNPPYLIAMTDDGVGIPIRFAAAGYDFKNVPITILDATDAHHAISKGQLDAKIAAENADAVSPNATDLATALTLINELKTVVNGLQAKLRAVNLLQPTSIP